MKKQVARTITTLSLFALLSVSASNVSAFPGGCGSCTPQVLYAKSAPAQTTNSAPVQVASSVVEPLEISPAIVALLWLRVAGFFSPLF